MGTLRKFISTVRGANKLISSDNLITDRVIGAVVQDQTTLLVKRESDLRKLWGTDTLFTTIPCLEMIEVPITECCGYIDDCTIARSKHKFPKVTEGMYKYLIQGIFSINALGSTGSAFKEMSLNRWINYRNLTSKKAKDNFYFIINDYLYVTNPDIELVRVVAYFDEDVPTEIMYSDCGCGNLYTDEDFCKNPLDKEFNLPSYLAANVLQMTVQFLMGTYFKTQQDLTSQGIENK